jgi:fatty-acid desaturase
MRMPKIFGNDKTFTQSPVWLTTFFIVAFHLGALGALFLFSWKAFLVAMGLWWVAGGFGVGIGYHRLLTHRGYKTPKWMEYLLTVCGTLALEGGPIFWSPHTANIIRTRTKKATRTLPATAVLGSRRLASHRRNHA